MERIPFYIGMALILVAGIILRHSKKKWITIVLAAISFGIAFYMKAGG